MLRRGVRVTLLRRIIRGEDAGETLLEEGAEIASGTEAEQVVVEKTAGVKFVLGAVKQIIGVGSVLRRTVFVLGVVG